MPTLTIGVFCFNHAPFIRECLDSLLVATYRSVRLVVTDDGSQDDSTKIIRDWCDRHSEAFASTRVILAKENLGFSRRLNLFMEEVSSPWFCVLSADDRFRPRGLDLLLNIASTEQSVDVIFGGYSKIDMEGRPLDFLSTHAGNRATLMNFHNRPQPAFRLLLIRGDFVPAGSTLFKLSRIRSSGARWNESLTNAEDYDFLLQLGPSARFQFVDEAIFDYRILASSKWHSAGARRVVSTLTVMARHMNNLEPRDKSRAIAFGVRMWLRAILFSRSRVRVSLRQVSCSLGISTGKALAAVPSAVLSLAYSKCVSLLNRMN